MLNINNLDEETLYEIERLLHRINFIAKSTFCPSVKTVEIEFTMQSLGDQATVILNRLAVDAN